MLPTAKYALDALENNYHAVLFNEFYLMNKNDVRLLCNHLKRRKTPAKL